MWKHKLLKSIYIGNYEYVNYGNHRVLRLEKRNAKGMTTGKVYTFSSWQKAKAAGWIHYADK